MTSSKTWIDLRPLAWALLACLMALVARTAYPAAPTLTPEGLDALLENHRGKVVLLDYWATWCPPCRDAAPELEALHQAHREQGLAVIGISFDREEDPVEEFIDRHGLSYPMFLGTGDLKQSQKVSVLPTTVLVDRDGSVAGRYIGYQPWESLDAKVRALLNP